jgi:hypothetical protein
LASCAGNEAVTVREAPRVERLDVPGSLLAPCAAAKADAPDPATASFLDTARYIVQLAARNDSCAGQVDNLRALLAP